METYLLGAEGYDGALDLGYKVVSPVFFLLRGLGSEVGSTEGGLLGASQVPCGCTGGLFTLFCWSPKGRLAASSRSPCCPSQCTKCPQPCHGEAYRSTPPYAAV